MHFVEPFFFLRFHACSAARPCMAAYGTAHKNRSPAVGFRLLFCISYIWFKFLICDNSFCILVEKMDFFQIKGKFHGISRSGCGPRIHSCSAVCSLHVKVQEYLGAQHLLYADRGCQHIAARCRHNLRLVVEILRTDAHGHFLADVAALFQLLRLCLRQGDHAAAKA